MSGRLGESLRKYRRLVSTAVALLIVIVVAVIKWRTITAWFWLFLTIVGVEVEVRGTTRLLNMWPEGRSPLLFMLNLDRWRGQAIGSLAERSDDPVVVAALTKVVREDTDFRGSALSSLGRKAAPEALAVLREYGEVRSGG